MSLCSRVLAVALLAAVGITTTDTTAWAGNNVVSVTGIRVGKRAPNRVRVVLDLAGPGTPICSLTIESNRVLVHLTGASWTTARAGTLDQRDVAKAFTWQQEGNGGTLTLSTPQPVVVAIKPTLLNDPNGGKRLYFEIAAEDPKPADAAMAPIGGKPGPDDLDAQVKRGVRAMTANPPDSNVAKEVLENAAAQGSLLAAFNLGQMYRLGLGTPKAPILAAQWYHHAAKADFPPAQTNLGIMLLLGDGIPADQKAALDWLRRAAPKDPTAKKLLGKAEQPEGFAPAR